VFKFLPLGCILYPRRLSTFRANTLSEVVTLVSGAAFVDSRVLLNVCAIERRLRPVCFQSIQTQTMTFDSLAWCGSMLLGCVHTLLRHPIPRIDTNEPSVSRSATLSSSSPPRPHHHFQLSAHARAAGTAQPLCPFLLVFSFTPSIDRPYRLYRVCCFVWSFS